MKKIYHYDGELSKDAIPVANGGIGDITAPKGCENIGLVSYDQDLSPYGIINLDKNRIVPKKALPGEIGDPSVASLEGNFSVTAGQKSVFVITNYDAYTIYSISVTAGYVTREVDKITYNAPQGVTKAILTINGKEFAISIGIPIPNTPSIVYPVEDGKTLELGGVITASNFSITGDVDAHLSSDWEVATDSEFANIAFSSYDSKVNLTTLDTSTIETGTKYYVRTRQHGMQLGVSAWSPVKSFTTAGWFNKQRVVPFDGTQYDSFGAGVAISGDGTYALVGSQGRDDKANDAGAVYVYTLSGSTWAYQQKLYASDPMAGDLFGKSVSLNADATVAVIGAQSNSSKATSAGCAYVFTRTGTTWTQKQKLFASDAVANDHFGYGVGISGDASYIIVGAPWRDDTATDGGSAYVFKNNNGTYTQESKLTPPDSTSDYEFGAGIALNSDATYAVIGSTHDDTVASDAGCAYVYTRSGSTWTQQAKLTSPNEAPSNFFGLSIGVNSDGSVVIVGAPSDSSKASIGGAIYMFSRNGSTWKQVLKLTPKDPAVNVGYGSGVALSADATKLLVGDSGDSGLGAYSGSVYYLEITKLGIEGNEVGKYFAPDALSNDLFGYSISLSDDGLYAAVGTVQRDDKATDAGCVYIFIRSGTTWALQAKLYSKTPNAGDFFGGSCSLNSDGSAIIVGSHGDSTVSSSAGAAYYFTRIGSVWTQQQKFFANDGKASDWFGISCSLNSDATIALVASHCDDTKAADAGAVYVFTRTGNVWTQQQKLYATDAAAYDYFGISCSINVDATIAVIGAHGNDDKGSGVGCIYIFTRSGDVWTQQQKLYPAAPLANASYGVSAALSGDGNFLAVGTTYNAKIASAGCVYIYRKDGSNWIETLRLYASDVVANQSYGRGVAFDASGTRLLIGACQDSTKASSAGAFYMLT